MLPTCLLIADHGRPKTVVLSFTLEVRKMEIFLEFNIARGDIVANKTIPN